MTRRRRSSLVAGLLALTCAPAALAHDKFDHSPPSFPPAGIPDPTFRSGGEGAKWELVRTIPTGNPHSDLDFFTQGGNTFAAVGTLAFGPNAGGQTLVQLTDGDSVDPRFVGAAPTADCVSDPSAVLSLQHDVEASPKGNVMFNEPNDQADRRDAQVILDATDAAGRCHDQGPAIGLSDAPAGGLEIIDVTDPKNPVEIGLTSHVGEAHTVNVDPRRPHIAYAVTSDGVTVDEEGKRENEDETDSDRFDLDGFEVVDFSSCLDFPPGTTLAEKRAACAPKVYRYRYPTLAMSQGHTRKDLVYGCHELEVYKDDRLTCASGQALIVLDMSKAFDDNGTPGNFRDDKPRGTPLPCTRRPSSSPAELGTGAQVVDCVDGTADGTDDLSVAKWLTTGAPSLEGVEHVGSAFHQGRIATGELSPFKSDQEIDFDHEAEYTGSRRFLMASDERGGGVAPPGATCPTGSGNENPEGNGGIHFYRPDALFKQTPENADAAWASYAKQPDGTKAIYRAPIRTAPEATFCTAHVFQQIPGQNRIFMGWYSQGTQVVDFTENADGTVSFKEAGWFTPTGANTWVSHVFKADRNPDGTWTYYGATADTVAGREAIDVYKVTLPAPQAAGALAQPARNGGGGQQPTTTTTPPQCTPKPLTLRRTSIRRRGSGVTFGFSSSRPVTIDVFRQSKGRSVLGERLVKRFPGVRAARRWNGRDRRGRRLGDGYYVARFRSGRDVQRIPMVRRRGRFSRLPAYDGRESCGFIRSFKLERPVFGGRTNRALNFAMRFAQTTRATVTIRRGNRVVRRVPARTYAAGRLHRVRLTVKRSTFPRGRYRVTVTAQENGRSVSRTLTTQRI